MQYCFKLPLPPSMQTVLPALLQSLAKECNEYLVTKIVALLQTS